MTTSVKLERRAIQQDPREHPIAAPVNIGDRVDHYRIDAFVARTGFATTFRGTDLNDGRSVAIKIPHLGLEGDPGIRERYRREERIVSQLLHAGVVRVLRDQWRSEFYLVTEWVEGRSLREILNQEGRLTPGRAARIGANICEPLYHIHSRGVVHRDIKPENILLDAADRITLIDFGIAAEGAAEGLALRKRSEAVGTPDYIAPEEVKGIRGDARSDLYALGIVIYEMLAGRTPFDGCNPLVVMNGRLLEDPEPLRMATPYVSRELEVVVSRALQRDPRRRYATAIEFARDLERHAAAERRAEQAEECRSVFRTR
jgi:eukaryotic-like serine/threonine-protein kinase